MRFKKVEEFKEWLKEHKRYIRDLTWYAAGFGVTIASFKLCNKLSFTNKACLYLEGNSDMFRISVKRKNRFGSGYTLMSGAQFDADQLESVEADFKDLFDFVRNSRES